MNGFNKKVNKLNSFVLFRLKLAKKILHIMVGKIIICVVSFHYVKVVQQ